MTNGSDVKICSEKQQEPTQGTVMNRYWDDGTTYRVKTGSQVVNLVDEDLQLDAPNFDFELWQPASDKTQDLSDDS